MPAPPSSAPAAITAAGPDDPYLLPPLLASLCLAEQGWRTMNLGPDTPFETILVAGARYHAALCGVSVSVAQPPDSGRVWSDFALNLKRRGIELVMGGRCMDTLPASLGGRVHVFGFVTELAEFAAKRIRPGPPKGRTKPAGGRGAHRG
jgi:hypothetical protein